MIIKICGLKTIKNSLTACQAGADMLGFNFYEPSPRYITIDTCREIITEIKATYPEISCVGVFVNHSPDDVKYIISETGLDLAQLSGSEAPADLEQYGPSAYKTLRPVTWQEAQKAIKALHTRITPPAFLLDKFQKGAYGGTGKTGDWKLAAEIAKDHSFLLAGGLNPENVAAAIQGVKPWGVDVASGVETERGKKDPEKIKTFIQTARTTRFSLNHD